MKQETNMALFGSYAPPGVYTNVVIANAGQPLFTNARIPVIIGEGQEYFQQNNVELFRGSSNVAQPQVVNENISNQITGITNEAHTTYFPVVVGGNVTGPGSSAVTNNPAYLQVTDNGIPLTVISLDGTTGDFSTQELMTPGDNVEISYYFLRTDTFVPSEDVSDQVPSFAAGDVYDTNGNYLPVSVSLPGVTGNSISISIMDDTLSSPPGTGVLDTQAISGAGTDSIALDIAKVGGGKRTLQDFYLLIQASIPTFDAGHLTAGQPVYAGSPPVLSPLYPAYYVLEGGLGPNTNTLFQVSKVPIVDGSGGGVVTTDPNDVTVIVNGSKVNVASVNGLMGQITVSSPVTFPSTVKISYYTNTYQNTYDIIPAQDVSSIVEVGLGPNRADFVQDTDYSLGTDSNGNSVINWGASTTTTVGVSGTGSTSPFGPLDINTFLLDEMVYLRLCSGDSSGSNLVFTLPDTPVDGTGYGIVTDDPTKIQVYVGFNPVEALESYEPGTSERVIALTGATGQFTLYNAPMFGANVYATYWRNTLNDHSYTATVVTPGISGQGTYTMQDEVGRVLPVVSFDATDSHVTQSGEFADTGIVWPQKHSDLYDAPGQVDETVTLTFVNDGYSHDLNPGAQAYLQTQGLLFFCTMPGAGGDAITIAINNTGTYGPPVVTINAIVFNGVTTTNQIATLAGGGIHTTFGTVLVEIITPGSVTTAAALHLAGGVDPANPEPYSLRYQVTSNNPHGSGGLNVLDPATHEVTGSGGVFGYLDQTYVDGTTDLKFTIVSPQDALSYGYQNLPDPIYDFEPGDTLVFQVSSETPRYTGTTYFPDSLAQYNNYVAIAGLGTQVITTFGASAGDTAIIQTFNKSGNQPAIGEFYYITFQTAKQPSDMAITLYTTATAAYAAYGQPNTINRVSLGVQFLTQNGAQQFGVIQVPKQAGLNTASDASFKAAIQTLTVNLPGLNQKANVVVPLSVSTAVHQFLSRQLITQANVRNKGEAIGFVGYATNTTPVQMQNNAQSLANARMIAMGAPAAGVLITNSLNGQQVEYAVDGSFIAAAMAGLNTNPANDVATTLTNQDLVGFSRLLVTYDDTTMNQMAANGLTCLTNNNGALNIRHYKSTDPSNPITSEPTCTTVTDYVCQQFRGDLKQFIGRKLVTGLTTDIQIVCNSRLTSLANNEIISGYTTPVVIPDPSDPTTVNVTVTFKPMFSLLYISVTFTVTTSL
jgi:hypothetical protein